MLEVESLVMTWSWSWEAGFQGRQDRVSGIVVGLIEGRSSKLQGLENAPDLEALLVEFPWGSCYSLA